LYTLHEVQLMNRDLYPKEIIEKIKLSNLIILRVSCIDMNQLKYRFFHHMYQYVHYP
jgi:hypothetical protein